MSEWAVLSMRLTERYRDAISVKRAAWRRAAIAGAETRRRQIERRDRRLMKVIEEIRAGGVTGLTAIAKQMNARGLRTSRGNPWSRKQVRAVLDRVESMLVCRAGSPNARSNGL